MIIPKQYKLSYLLNYRVEFTNMVLKTIANPFGNSDKSILVFPKSF